LTNRTGRKISWTFVLLPLVGLVAYLAYAAFALTRTFDALASGDAGNVEKYVDLDSVRGSLKSQVAAEIERTNAGLKKTGANIGELIGVGVLSAFESGLANGIIDAVVTPEGLANILAGKKEARQSSGEGSIGALWRNVRIEPPDTIRFSRQAGFDAIFRFDGVSWRLVDVRVPFRELIKNRAGGPGR
jgi:Protein of unknown function (DUF2939)